MSDKTCKTCEWWERHPVLSEEVGDCVWLPPTVVSKAARSFHDGIAQRHEPEGTRTIYPETYADSRCGQWSNPQIAKRDKCDHRHRIPERNAKGDLIARLCTCGHRKAVDE